MNITLSGKEYGLKFNIGTLNVLHEQFGIDPLKFKAESDSWKDLLPYACMILYAALSAFCRSNKNTLGFSPADVEEMMDDLSVTDLTDIITAYNNIFNRVTPSVNGEVDKGAQLNVG